MAMVVKMMMDWLGLQGRGGGVWEGGVISHTVNLFLRYDDEQCSQWRLGECSIS